MGKGKIMVPGETSRIALALKGCLNGAGLTNEDLERIAEDPELAALLAGAFRDATRDAPVGRECFTPVGP